MAAIRAPLQYVGPIKRNLQIVDGVVGNLFSAGDLDVSTNGDFWVISVIGPSGRDSINVAEHVDFKKNTQYTFNIDTYEEASGFNNRLRIVYDDGSAEDIGSTPLVETNYIVTSQSGKTIDSISFLYSLIGGNTYIRRSTFKCYEGDTYPSPLPTSGQPVTGNSFLWTDKERTIYPEAARTDRNWNEVDNYDFSDGANDWSASFSTNTVAANVLSNTCDGTDARGLVNFGVGTTVQQGDVWFLFARVRVTNSDCEIITLRLRDGSGLAIVASENNPAINQWYELYAVREIEDYFQNSYGRVQHDYIDATTANGKVAEIDGVISNGGGSFMLNLSEIDRALGTSYATMTAEEINAIKYDLLGEIWHTNTTDAVPEAKLVPITSDMIIWNDQYFWNSPCMLMYNQSFSGDDLTKIQQFMGF